MKTLLQELNKNEFLKWVGIIFCLEHLLTIFFWSTERPLHLILTNPTFRICWPHWESCQYLSWNNESVRALLILYLALALFSIILWIAKSYRAAILGTISTLALKNFIIVQDYRLGGNYHYIPTLLCLAFLFLPNRTRSLPFFFWMIYFTAGILKLDTQWLSGAAINERLFPPIIIQIGVWYVLVLEIIFSFFIFSKNRNLFWFFFTQIFIFHLFSWHLTRFFYPSVMLLMLAILILLREIETPSWSIKDVKKFFRQRPVAIAVSIFVFLQLPQYYLPGKAALTGQGRSFALIMYDGRTDCQPHLSVWRRNQVKEELPLTAPWLITRIKCDPIIYKQLAERVCQWSQKDDGVEQIDLHLPIKYENETEYRSIVSVNDICNKKLSYSNFFPNYWIRSNNE